jgi:hypothetical protein
MDRGDIFCSFETPSCLLCFHPTFRQEKVYFFFSAVALVKILAVIMEILALIDPHIPSVESKGKNACQQGVEELSMMALGHQ